MDKSYYIPQYLDEPERFFFFTTDEAIIVMILVSLGILTGYFMLGFVLAMCAFWLHKKYVGQEGKSYLMCLRYWYLPHCFSQLKYAPPSFRCHYFG